MKRKLNLSQSNVQLALLGSWFPDQQDKWDRLGKAKAGIELDVSAVKIRRSVDQQGLYWTGNGQWSESSWARENGMTKGALHELCLAKCFGFDIVDVSGIPIAVPNERSRNQSILPYSDLINTQHVLMAETGFSLRETA